MNIESNNTDCISKSFSSIPTSNDLRIAYMINPDIVIYDELDHIFIKSLEDLGAKVTIVHLEDISFHISKETQNTNTIYIKDKPIEIDGFMSYGSMSEFHFKAYCYVIRTLSELNIPTLYSPEAQLILNDKYLQALRFKKAGVKVPSTNIGFSIESYKAIINNFYPDSYVLKRPSDYGGDSVTVSLNSQNAVNQGAKLLWKNEYCIYQQTIKDSPRKSIRVLCIDGKPIACVQYVNSTNDLRSNYLFGKESIVLESLMESPKLKEYFEVAQKSIDSIEVNLTVVGVDILDSKEHGLVVLEVNVWPDLDEVKETLNIDTHKLLSKAFLSKVNKVKSSLSLMN